MGINSRLVWSAPNRYVGGSGKALVASRAGKLLQTLVRLVTIATVQANYMLMISCRLVKITILWALILEASAILSKSRKSVYIQVINLAL